MSVAPRNKPARIAFFAARIGPWTSAAATLKIEPADVAALDTKVTAAQAAHADFVEKQAAARSATITYDQAVIDMTNAGMQLIERIRATARTAGDGIYALADLPVPATPAPIAPPGQPTDFKVSLDGNGDLTITFKADNPAGAQGTIYRVYRTIEGQPQTYLGDIGGRKFIDTTLPAGATLVTYAIQGVRSTAVGMWGNFVVKFGTNAGGEAVAAIMSPKLAA